MKLRELTADHIGKMVRVKTPTVEVTGILAGYTHYSADAVQSWSVGPVRAVIGTDVIVGPQSLNELGSDSSVEVLA